MPGTHSGRVAVVTGAAGGIGQAVCRQLADRGAAVVAVDLAEPAQTLEQLAAAGHEGFGIRADVSDPDQTRHIGEEVRERYGRCDIPVNNAGIYPNYDIDHLDYATWRRVLAVNLDSQFLMASKMGAIGFTRGLANDVAGFGVTVNAVGPSLTRTPGILSSIPDAVLDQIAGLQAIKRVAEPDDVVGTILFLTGEDSDFVTGQTIMADGGLTRL